MNNTTDSVIRIEILGQRDRNSAVTIDRTMTPKLASTYSAGEWNTFCEKVDTVLEPILGLKKKTIRMQWMQWMPAISFFIFVIAFGFYQLTGYSRPTTVMYIIPTIPCIILLLSVGILSKKLNRDISAVKVELKKVVNEESSKRIDVTFRLMDEVSTIAVLSNGTTRTRVTYYIACVIGSGSTAVPMGGDLWNAAPASSGMAFTGTKTTAERLQELDAAKPYMTEDDYNEKKAAILAAL